MRTVRCFGNKRILQSNRRPRKNAMPVAAPAGE
jgi:hypothetical protein